MNNGTVTDTTVYAAGGVLWRLTGGRLRVLVIHRDTHGDTSFPKGKIKAGEILAETAAREVREETGVAAALGPPIGVTRYTLPGGREKVVHYWSMRAKERAVRESSFTPNREVAAVEWLAPDIALTRLSYDFDVDILTAFLEQFESGSRATFPIVTLRHGSALSRGEWQRADRLRPLMLKGTRQAHALVRQLRAFGVRKIVSSTATRCLQTVAPLSHDLGRPVTETDAISQDAWEDGLGDATGVVAARLAAGKGAVLCSHGPVIPGILEQLAVATGARASSLAEHASPATAAYAVAHISKHEPQRRIVAVESHRAIS